MKKIVLSAIFFCMFFTGLTQASDVKFESFASQGNCNLWMSDDYVNQTQAKVVSVKLTPTDPTKAATTVDTIKLITKGYQLNSRQTSPTNRYLEGLVDSSDSICPEMDKFYRALENLKKKLGSVGSENYYRTRPL